MKTQSIPILGFIQSVASDYVAIHVGFLLTRKTAHVKGKKNVIRTASVHNNDKKTQQQN